MNLDKKKEFIIKFAYFAVWIAIIYISFKISATYLFPFLIGIVIAYFVQKPAEWISDKTRFKKGICAAVLSVVLFVFIIFLIVFLVWSFYKQFTDLIAYLPDYVNKINDLIQTMYSCIDNLINSIDDGLNTTFFSITKSTLNSFVSKTSTIISNCITSIIKNLPTLLISCGVTVVATFYISKDYNRLLKFFRGFISDELYIRTTEIKDIFTECFLKIVIGYFWLFVITFFELILGFFILKIKHAIVLAFLIALLDLLPIIGTGTVLLPWALLGFVQGNFTVGFGIIVLYLFIAILRNFIEPKIIGKQTGINPIFTLIFIFWGYKMGGMIWMILLPIIFTVLFTFYRRKSLKSN